MIDHRNTPALSADDRLRVEWTYKRYVKGRNVLRSDMRVSVPFTEPPQLMETGFWDYYSGPSDIAASEQKLEYKVMEFSGEILGYVHQSGVWEWVNVYAHFKGVTVCVDHWPYASRYAQHRNANQF